MSAPPVWHWLNDPGGPHWETLIRDYVPEGLLDLIPSPPDVVLDVGCFCGETGARLKARYPGVRVVGIEPLDEAVKEARCKLDAVLHGKFEDVDLSEEGIIPGTVNAVILADVLEHMYNPWQALISLRPLLAPNGFVLASIPNIRNFAIIDELVRGDFPYAGAGILDITHIRFFTWLGIQRLFGETGYRIEQIILNPDPRCQPLLEGLKQGPRINIDSPSLQIKNLAHEQLRELATLQFYLRARPI
jgi:SAM-dependent methyltransferase